MLEQIVKEEQIEASQEEADAEIQKMADAYGMEADKIRELMGEAEKASMMKDLAVQKAVRFVMDHSVEAEV